METPFGRSAANAAQYRLAPDIFYRKYGSDTIIYQTSKSKVYHMSESCFDVLDYYRQNISEKSIFEYLGTRYDMDSAELQSELQPFISELARLDILLQKENKMPDASRLEAKVFENILVPSKDLYSCMFELTYRCNERCKHCYCVTDSADGELTADEIRNLIDQLYELNTLELVFTGGDLFVRKDTFEILEYAYSKGFLINIFTNGIALKDDDFFRLQQIHPKSISFSLYDTIPDKHDMFTSVQNSFTRTLSAAKKCRALGIPVHIKTNVTKDNFSRIGDFTEMVMSIGADLEISLSITPRNDGDLSPTQYRLSCVGDYKNVLDKISPYLSESSNPAEFIPLSSNRDLCRAGKNSLSINPYGKVFACNALLIECGDTRKQTLAEIWNKSEALEKIRSYKTGDLIGCDGCEDRTYCSFCMGNSYTETGSPLKKYREACNITKAQTELRKEKKNV